MERVGELMSVQEGISLSLNQSKIGQTMTVLIDRIENDYYVARSEFDSPEVDNEVLIRKNNGILLPGTFCKVKITRAESFDLFAELQ
jgi:ribosomal protein S12 methylthiotransferase